MTVDRTLAITERIVRQMLRDRRSVGLLIVGPLIVMSLVGFSLFEQRAILDRVAPGLLAVFVLFFTFILTGVGFLRERAQGTLEQAPDDPRGQLRHHARLHARISHLRGSADRSDAVDALACFDHRALA